MKIYSPFKTTTLLLGRTDIESRKSYLLTSRTDPYSYYSQILKVAFSLCMTENVYRGATVAAYGSTVRYNSVRFLSLCILGYARYVYG